jgi:hypothetical protein
MSKEWPSRGKNRASYEPVGKRLDIAINFVVLVLVAILFTETGIAQTDVPFLKRHEGDYVGVPSSASVALLSARPGDTDRTQDPAAVELRELERRSRQMVDARAQEEALLRVDTHLSIRKIGNVWQIALKFEGAPPPMAHSEMYRSNSKKERYPAGLFQLRVRRMAHLPLELMADPPQLRWEPRAWTHRATFILSKYYCAAQTKV